MVKQKSVAKLKKEADKWFSKYVRYRDSYVQNGVRVGECITCKTVRRIEELQAGHFVSRRVNTLRYDEENVNIQDYSCNVMKYGEQYLYAKAIDLKYGDGTADKLMAQRFSTHKFTIDELQDIIKNAREQINFYQTGTDEQVGRS